MKFRPRSEAILPAQIEKALGSARADGLLPDFPFGTDMTAEERELLPALGRLKAAQGSPVQLAVMAFRGWQAGETNEREQKLLRRLDLDAPKSLKERAFAALVRGALR